MRAILLLLPLMGCASVDNAVLGDPVREEARTPRSIAFCYSSNRSTLGEVTARAQAHCQAQGLNARLAGSDRCRMFAYTAAIFERASFDCVP